LKKIFAGNWKLNKTPRETEAYFVEWRQKAGDLREYEIVFFPPATNFDVISKVTSGSNLRWGAQNCYAETKGAFTGEISAQTIKDMGGAYVLVGHSERRSVFHENDILISKKVGTIQKVDLIPMLCIGESLSERDTGNTMYILKSQLEAGLSHADPRKPIVIAYEPVWAIGTGKVATADQVREAHKEIHHLIQSLGFPASTPILYGGSVKSENAKELISIPHVDGFLVGGASLDVTSFLQICKAN
jgi:triosephosphate isomerase (TIM)